MSDRGSCWSITINNPTQADTPTLPAGWVFKSQLEKGKEGTEHIQGCLTTGATVRFSAVKKVFPRAHIELARNKAGLMKYVKKEDTRIATIPDQRSDIPTLFDYQGIIADMWVEDDFQKLCEKYFSELGETTNKIPDTGDIALEYLDSLVAKDIECNGRKGAEYIAINPMWRSSWKKFYRSIIRRNGNEKVQQEGSQADVEEAPGETSPADE